MSKSAVDYFGRDDLKDELRKHAIRGGGITAISRMVNFLIQTLTTIVLARILTPKEFGLMAMVTSICGFLIIFTDLGLQDAIVQKKIIDHNQISTLFWINAVITAAIVMLIMGLSSLVSWFYGEPVLRSITIVWSLSIFFSALSTQHLALLIRKMLFLRISVIEILATLISNFAAIILALKGWSYWALVFRQVLLGICMTAGCWLLCRWRPGLPNMRADVRSMLVFGRNTIGYFVSNYFARNLDKILIGERFSAEALGYYYKAYYLFVLPTTQLTTALQNVAVSTLSQLRSDSAKYQNYYLNAISIMSFIAMPISFFFMIESEDLVLMLLGSQWYKTSEIFRILAAGTGVWVIYSTIYWLHASLGRSDRLLRWGIFALLVTGLAMVLGLKFGPKGVAVSSTAALYLLAGLGLHYAGKPINLQVKSVILTLWKYFAAAIIAGLFCWYITQALPYDMTRVGRLVLSFVVYVCLYLPLVVGFHGSMQPIVRFYSVIREILPEKLAPISK